MLHPDLRMIPFPALRNMVEEEAIDVMIGFRDEKTTLLPSLMLNLPSAESPVPCQKNIPSQIENNSR